jgi:hypothetical protein
LGDRDGRRWLITKSAQPPSEHRPSFLGVQGAGVAAHAVDLVFDVDNGGLVEEPIQDRRRHDLVGEHGSAVENPRLEVSTIELRS